MKSFIARPHLGPDKGFGCVKIKNRPGPEVLPGHNRSSVCMLLP